MQKGRLIKRINRLIDVDKQVCRDIYRYTVELDKQTDREKFRQISRYGYIDNFQIDNLIKIQQKSN